MFKNKASIFLIFATVVTLSCSSNQSIFPIGARAVSSPKTPATTLSPVDSITGSCMEAVSGICYVTDSIALLDLYENPYCFRALNLLTLNYTDFLRTGRGPEEATVAFFSQVRKDRDTMLVDITAINEHSLLSIDLSETIKQGKTVIQEKTYLPPHATFSYIIGDKILSQVLNDEDIFSLKLYDRVNQRPLRTVKLYGDEPYLVNYYPLFNSSKRIKPDGTRMSLCMLHFDEINILDIEGENHLSVSTSRRCKDASIVSNALKTGLIPEDCYYFSQAVSNNYIYALYYNGEAEETQESSTIHVFTWEGALSASYYINEPLIGIAVSEDETALYGLSGEEVVYKYALK